MNLFIYGSCVSRDIFNSPIENIDIVDYFARSSFASLGLLPADHHSFELDVIASPFQRRMVERDLSKEIFSRLHDVAFDLLLVDLIDERFDIGLLEDGAGLTISPEFSEMGHPAVASFSSVIGASSSHFMQLWERGWNNFWKNLVKLNLTHKLVINEVYWSERTDGGTEFPSVQVNDANACLTAMYDRIALDVPESQFLRFQRSLFQGFDRHRWGLAPFHYIDEYYVTAAAKLVELGKRIDPQIIDQLNFRLCFLADTAQADGRYLADLGATSFEFMIDGLGRLDSSGLGNVLVTFSGAVEGRASKTGPFFSGLQLAKRLGLPLIAVADPTVTQHDSLGLGWYAGNNMVPRLPHDIATFLNRFAQKNNVQLLLVGGSGGGFAAISIQALLSCRNFAFVWNPQTSIAKYDADSVDKYVAVAFPDLTEDVRSELGGVADSVCHQRILGRSGVRHDIRHVSPASGQLIYFQNRSDWHVGPHAAEFMRWGKWSRLGPRSFSCVERNVRIFFGEWGQGHVAPPAEMIDSVLTQCVIAQSADEIVLKLDDESAGKENRFVIFEIDGISECHMNVQAALGENDEIFASVELGMEGLEYAFYLQRGSDRLAVSWYSHRSSVSFKVADERENLSVIAFARDHIGSKIIKQVPVLFAN